MSATMEKNYWHWHNRKVDINGIIDRPFFHEKEIWYGHLGVNIGFEQDGVGDDFLRPIVIIRKFNNEIFWAIPLTSRFKKSEYYFSFSFIEDQISTAILSQIRLVDARRLSHMIGYIQDADFIGLKEKLKALLP